MHQLSGKLDKCLAALGRWIKDNAGQAITRGLGQSHIARYDGVENLVAKMLFELFAHLLLQCNSRIKHDPKQTNDFQIGV